MSRPKYSVTISGDKFNKRGVSCTGLQLSLIVNELLGCLKDITWYASDVTTISRLKNWSNFLGSTPAAIGDSSTFDRMLLKTEQFMSGVFLAVARKNILGGFLIKYETEDEAYRDIEFAELEIRAFDTSYYEIYTSKRCIVESLAKRFKCQIMEIPCSDNL